MAPERKALLPCSLGCDSTPAVTFVTVVPFPEQILLTRGTAKINVPELPSPSLSRKEADGLVGCAVSSQCDFVFLIQQLVYQWISRRWKAPQLCHSSVHH